MNGAGKLMALLACCLLAAGASGCVKVDNTMGMTFVPDNERFFTRTVTIPLDSIYVGYVDSLSAFNSQRFTIGAVRDDLFGLTRRTAAFSLVPLADSLKWGKNIRNVHFHFGAILDSLSYFSADQQRIIQNIRVYSLKDAGYCLDSSKVYSCDFKKSDFDKLKGKEVSDGIPAYNGSDSLAFDFCKAFTDTYLVDKDGKSWEGRTQVIVNQIDAYQKTYPGIFICVDDPENISGTGRIEYFKTAPVITDNSYLSGSFIEMSFTADYGSRQVDTSFFYTIGATGTKYESSTLFYAFNCCEHESQTLKEDGRYGKKETIGGRDFYLISDNAVIEGGAGMKPIIMASHLRNVVKDSLAPVVAKYGMDDIESVFTHRKIFINRATLVLPYQCPEKDWSKLHFYPPMMSPTLSIHSNNNTGMAYAGLEDAGVKGENQGNIDYDNACYRPDIACHLQEILCIDLDKNKAGYNSNLKKLNECNMWLFSLANEVITTIATKTSNNDYLSYLNYYYGMMNGDYSGGGYGGYYNYAMLQAMYDSSNTSGSSTTSVKAYTLDKDRYYNSSLLGPYKDKAGTVRRDARESPHLVLTYSFLLPESLRN